MTENKILHVMILDKFLVPYIDFIDENFGRENHYYVFITSEKYEYGLTPEHKVEFLHTVDDIFITLLEYMKISKKIILHGLWRDKVDILLYFNQELLKKCYWIMWGGDFYFPETKGKIRHEIIKNMGSFIHATEEDFNYIIENYKIKNRTRFKNRLYPTCIPSFQAISQTKNNILKILVGNSATETNKHKEIFEILDKYKNNDIEIITPLNYGDKQYRDEILKLGNELFGNKFKPITDFMDFNSYETLLSTVDIAIFNHNRQQGGANIMILIGYGKKVYISKQNTFYSELKSQGIKIFDLEDFNLEQIDKPTVQNNIEIAINNFSKKALIKSWKKIFSSK